MEAVLDRVMMLFRYLQEKDVFEKYYKQHLAKRLLSGRTARPPPGAARCCGAGAARARAAVWGSGRRTPVPNRIDDGAAECCGRASSWFPCWRLRPASVCSASAYSISFGCAGVSGLSSSAGVAQRVKRARRCKRPRAPAAAQVSDDAERSLLVKLKTECGYQFTSKLESMFTDIKTSRDTMAEFRARRAASGLPDADIELSVQVLRRAPRPALLPPCRHFVAFSRDCGTFGPCTAHSWTTPDLPRAWMLRSAPPYG
jgi:hypothetical protein